MLPAIVSVYFVKERTFVLDRFCILRFGLVVFHLCQDLLQLFLLRSAKHFCEILSHFGFGIRKNRRNENLCIVSGGI